MLATFTCAIVLFCSWLMPVLTGQVSKSQRAEALTNYGLDPSTALESRISETPAAVLKEFKDAGANPTAHVLTAGDGRKRNVSIQGGTLDAIVYVLLHEATHMGQRR